MTTQDHLSMTFAALADPTRRAILTHLMRGEVAVKDLARPFEMSLPGISKHLKVLERAGLIERGRTAQWRPCRLKAQPLKEASGWIEHYRRFWEESFDRLDKYLQELQAQAEPIASAKRGGRPEARKATRLKRERKKHVRQRTPKR